MDRLRGSALCAVVWLGAGCGAASAPPAGGAEQGEPPALAAALAGSCERARPGLGPSPERGGRQGSSVVLGRDGESLVAYVADRDRNRIVTVDVTARRVRGSTAALGAPEQVVILGDGRVVAAVGSGRHLEVFEPTADPATPLRRLCAREVPAGPFGLAVSPDEGTLAVTSAWEPALTSFDMTLAERSVQALSQRAPRGVLVDHRGRAFVTHLVGGALSVVTLPRAGEGVFASIAPVLSIPLGVRAGSPAGPESSLRVMRQGSQAYALAGFQVGPRRALGIDEPDPVTQEPRLVVPMVSVDPGDASRSTERYYGPPPVAGVQKAAPVAVVVDTDERRSLTTHVVATTGGQRAEDCQLPRAVAAHPREPRIYVTCLGLDELLELDARSADPMRTVRRRFAVPSGPTGVALAAREDFAVVFGQFDEELAVLPLGERSAFRIRLEGGTSSLSRAAQRGRAFFYRSDDLRITRDGMACSSCHPDGTEDSLTWFTPDGPRQTIMLAGRLPGTAPFGWTREQPTLKEYIADTCRRLGGSGLPDDDLRDLIAFLQELPSPPRARPAPLDLVATGRQVFGRRGCAQCHVTGTGTDGQPHKLDGEDKAAVDTPSLRSVGSTGPYFHDGRYTTLDDLLGDRDSRMGATAQLSPPERKALRAFLESL
jgi:mono/diheme cytochrome c family protein